VHCLVSLLLVGQQVLLAQKAPAPALALVLVRLLALH
jgi:hypothetical protein